jgi:hypothetical protein
LLEFLKWTFLLFCKVGVSHQNIVIYWPVNHWALIFIDIDANNIRKIT